MPYVHVELFEGRTVEQKLRLPKRLLKQSQNMLEHLLLEFMSFLMTFQKECFIKVEK